MPACIVLVHDDPGFANPALAALRAAGYDAVGFQDSMSAIDALEHPKRIELLITRVRYPSGTPNGVALACMARLKRPGIKVLFTSFPEVRQHTDGIGEFLPRPLSSDELLETVARMLTIIQSVCRGALVRSRRKTLKWLATARASAPAKLHHGASVPTTASRWLASPIRVAPDRSRSLAP